MLSIRAYLYNRLKDLGDVYYDEAAGDASPEEKDNKGHNGEENIPVVVFRLPNVMNGIPANTDQVFLEIKIYGGSDTPEAVEQIAISIDQALSNHKCVNADLKFIIRRLDPYWTDLPPVEGVKAIRLQYMVKLFQQFYL